MKYNSTRGTQYEFSSAEVIMRGIAPDGGLFVPDHIPRLGAADLIKMSTQSYTEVASAVIGTYLDDYSQEELKTYCDLAYDPEVFGEIPAPLVQLNAYNEREYILELWHGPTAAFKDMALQLLPHLMKAAQQKAGDDREICILTATSGDTGIAALHGFSDVEGTRIMVFYPTDGVSEVQKRQMTTTTSKNAYVVGVKGCFDDTQSGVKAIFADEKFAEALGSEKKMLSSANSINWGRLVPQIAYYVWSYASLIGLQKISYGEKVNFVVPTGNFGNILAAWYAMKMGIPVHRLICASNKNKVLSDFFRSGIYNKKREFFKTSSPSMDILISSNLERLLYELTDKDGKKVKDWMQSLSDKGDYTIDPATLKALQQIFVGGFADEAGTTKTILDVYDRCDHVVDTHTAVGFNVYGRYYQRSGDESKTVFVSAASPYKFVDHVMDALRGSGYSKGRSMETLISEFFEESSLEIPLGIKDLFKRPVVYDDVIDKKKMPDIVKSKFLDGK